MAFLDRLFGIIDDATAGGKDYDTISGDSPVIPNANLFFPVTGGTFDPGIERIDRNDEVRGRRANVHPRPFRSAPMITVPMSMYRVAAEKFTHKLLGATTTTGGGGATPYTHAIRSIGYPNVNLPALHAELVRDDTNIKMAGCTVNRITYDFPLDGEGTMEIELFGKYFDEFATASPSPTFPNMGATADTLMLRDAQAFIDGSLVAIPDLQGFSLTFSNNLLRKWYAGRNVRTRVLGSPSQTKKLWFPTENKAQAAPDITYSLTFGNTADAQEIAMWYAQVQSFIFEIEGLPLTGAYSATLEMMRVTIDAGVHTGGGADALSARDDITSTFEGGVFYSETVSRDLLIEFVSDTAVLA